MEVQGTLSVILPDTFVFGFFCHSSLFPSWATFLHELEALPLPDTEHSVQTLHVAPRWRVGLCGCVCWKAVHFTLIGANPWGRMVPRSGVMVNSCGFITGISSLFQIGLLLSEYCSQLEMLLWPTPSPGIRSLKVMGTKEVLLREHIKVWGNPGKQNMKTEIKPPSPSHQSLLWN